MIERIGGRQEIPVDVRIVCATHQDLEALIADGRFREDLYYRLAEIVVEIPSLAERPGDAVLLRTHFVNRFGARAQPRRRWRSRPTRVDAIEAYGWPGNVRELENRIKRAVIMADGNRVTADRPRPAAEATAARRLPINLRAARETADRKAIRQALSRTDGKSRAPPSCSGSAARRSTTC